MTKHLLKIKDKCLTGCTVDTKHIARIWFPLSSQSLVLQLQNNALVALNLEDNQLLHSEEMQ